MHTPDDQIQVIGIDVTNLNKISFSGPHIFSACSWRAQHTEANVGPHFRVFIDACYTDYFYIMRNDFGESVTAEFFAVLRLKSARPYWARQFKYWNGDGPVPGTDRRGSGHYFRNIRYINAKRAAHYFSDEGEIAPRAARSVVRLPDAWDDLAIASRHCRSWKQYRKVQWR